MGITFFDMFSVKKERSHDTLFSSCAKFKADLVSLDTSPNTLKIRYVLNYKKLDYETVWLSYPDIAPNHKKLGIKANKVPEEANWAYTCAAIKDGDVAVQNGVNNIEHLEKAYPNAPSVYPYPGSKALSQAVENLSMQMPTFKAMLPRMPAFLDDRGGKYFAEDRKSKFGIALDEFGGDKKEAWKGMKAQWAGIAPLLEVEGGPFLCGDKPIYGDFWIAAIIGWIKATSEEDFKDFIAISPNFEKFWQAMQPYV